MPLKVTVNEMEDAPNSRMLVMSGDFDEQAARNFGPFTERFIAGDDVSVFVLEVGSLKTVCPQAVDAMGILSEQCKARAGAVILVHLNDTLETAIDQRGLKSRFVTVSDYLSALETCREIQKAKADRKAPPNRLPGHTPAPAPGTSQSPAPPGSGSRQVVPGNRPGSQGTPVLPTSPGTSATPPPVRPSGVPPTSAADADTIQMPRKGTGAVPPSEVGTQARRNPDIKAASPKTRAYRAAQFPEKKKGVSWSRFIDQTKGPVSTQPPAELPVTRLKKKPADILIAMADSVAFRYANERIRNVCASWNFEVRSLFPRKVKGDLKGVLEEFDEARFLIADVTPNEPAPDPDPDIVIAVVIGLLRLPENHVLLINSGSRPPRGLLHGYRCEYYQTSRKGLEGIEEMLTPHLERLDEEVRREEAEEQARGGPQIQPPEQ